MGLIKYDGKTLINAKNTIEICNCNILDSLKKINIELLNMEMTMSTPKSKGAISMYNSYYDNKIKYVSNNKDKYNQLLTDINNNYIEYMNTIKETVGDK